MLRTAWTTALMKAWLVMLVAENRQSGLWYSGRCECCPGSKRSGRDLTGYFFWYGRPRSWSNSAWTSSCPIIQGHYCCVADTDQSLTAISFAVIFSPDAKGGGPLISATSAAWVFGLRAQTISWPFSWNSDGRPKRPIGQLLKLLAPEESWRRPGKNVDDSDPLDKYWKEVLKCPDWEEINCTLWGASSQDGGENPQRGRKRSNILIW